MANLWYLGVDGGGSKTHAWIVGPGGLAGSAVGPGSNHQTVGLERAVTHIHETVVKALAVAELDLADVSGAVLGLSGADFPVDVAKLQEALRPTMPTISARIVNDAEIALIGGAQQDWGVVVVAGQGTNIYARDADGHGFHMGGLGYEMGDIGSGSDIIRTTLHHAFRSQQGRGPKTLLEQAVLDILGQPDYDALAYALYGGAIPEERFFGLVPRVFEIAASGDSMAEQILVRMGTGLGESAGAAVRRLNVTGATVEIVLVGSLWEGASPFFRDAFYRALHRYARDVDVHRPLLPPVAGAVLLAVYDQAGDVTTMRRLLGEVTTNDN